MDVVPRPPWRDRMAALANDPRARRIARWAAIALAVPSLQVLVVRFVTPPLTLTMVQRGWETVGSDDGARWVDYRPLPLDMLGDAVPRAAVASEDGWFFHHGGFDLGQIRAAASAGGARGASTISQQVAKNVFLWQGRSWVRKGLEVGYTALLELFVPKERILELYLSVAETGPMVFGAEAGAQHWYHKAARELTPSEAAHLIALLPNPRVWRVTDARVHERAREILAARVPFPGEPGFDRMAEEAPARVGWRALLGVD
ncbi:MAG TPA: monofunctional biosynthetic peptidoglycan transglycosylase [Myxococcota bacterium]|nr:monofunctional biosynthetic peptidoglycan transglycosylase [Myxococcota bacterium]